MAEERVSVENGKYTVVIGDRGELKALRHGEPWQDLTGNKMVYCLATELRDARAALDAEPTPAMLRAGIAAVSWADLQNPSKACENMRAIFKAMTGAK